MKTMNSEQMVNVIGGRKMDAANCKRLDYIVYIAGVGSIAGLPGLLIFGPTALIGGALGLALC